MIISGASSSCRTLNSTGLSEVDTQVVQVSAEPSIYDIRCFLYPTKNGKSRGFSFSLQDKGKIESQVRSLQAQLEILQEALRKQAAAADTEIIKSPETTARAENKSEIDALDNKKEGSATAKTEAGNFSVMAKKNEGGGVGQDVPEVCDATETPSPDCDEGDAGVFVEVRVDEADVETVDPCTYALDEPARESPRQKDVGDGGAQEMRQSLGTQSVVHETDEEVAMTPTQRKVSHHSRLSLSGRKKRSPGSSSTSKCAADAEAEKRTELSPGWKSAARRRLPTEVSTLTLHSCTAENEPGNFPCLSVQCQKKVIVVPCLVKNRRAVFQVSTKGAKLYFSD